MSEKLRILMLEDRPTDAELVLDELRQQGIHCDAKRVMTESDFLEQLRVFQPDLILADYALPGYDGLSALASVSKLHPEIPFVFVSGTLGEEKAIEALHHGATDYVLKQRMSRLGPTVRRALSERQERRERVRVEKQNCELNLLLRAVRGIDQSIVREREPERLLAKACEILVQTRGYLFAWVGLAEPDSKRVVPAAQGGEGAGFLETMTVTWDETPTGQGPVGSAIRTGRPWVCHDTAADPRYAPWKGLAQARGFAAVAAVPMMQGGRALGALAVYSGRTSAFVEEETDLLNELATDLAFALRSIEDENERKRAAEARQESELQYRTLADSGQALIWASGLDKKCNYFNRPWLTFTGRTLEQELGDGWAEGVHPDDLDRCLEIYTGAYDRRERFSMDYRLRHQDGKFRWIQDDGTPRYDRQGNFLGFIGHCLDITERKQAEQRTSTFSDLGQSLSTASTQKAAAKVIMNAADTLFGLDACTVVLYSAEDDVAKDVLVMDTMDGRRVEIPTDDSDTKLSEFSRKVVLEGAQLVLRGQPAGVAPPLQPFGEVHRPSASLMFVPIRLGKAVVGVISIQSYTANAYDEKALKTLQTMADYCGGAMERLRTEEKRRNSEALYNSLVEHLPQNIFRKDLTGHFTFANARFLQTVGRPRDEILGKTDLDFCPRALADKYRADDRRVVETGELFEAVEEYSLPNGKRAYVQVIKIPVRDASGLIIGVQGISWDVTERKQAEARLDCLGARQNSNH